MPAKPSYAHKLSSAIQDLEKGEARLVGRRDIEELLGVSKTIAWRILRACKAEVAPGGALLCERLVLIERLKELAAEGGVVSREAARHQRVAEQLDAMRGYLKSRETKVVQDEAVPALRARTFGDLPANITFTSSSLLIEFADIDEFLAAVGAVVFALQNDLDAIREFIVGSLH